jgi:hypothetical protein
MLLLSAHRRHQFLKMIDSGLVTCVFDAFKNPIVEIVIGLIDLIGNFLAIGG